MRRIHPPRRSIIPLGAAVMMLASVLACVEPRPDEPEPTVPRSPPSPPVDAPPGPADWLRGDVDARFALVAKHLRGFDMAMVEVGYRYTELHWAARDRNWEYAAYQLGKIETAVANGLERRPQRATSARMLEGPVFAVRTALDARDGPGLDTALAALTTTCNACHHAEQLPFITVVPPTVRLSPVQYQAPPAEHESP